MFHEQVFNEHQKAFWSTQLVSLQPEIRSITPKSATSDASHRAAQNSQHNKSQIALYIIRHGKAHRTGYKERKKNIKIEPINKSNAKRIINNNWFENYGATVPFWAVFRVPGLKKRWKRAAKEKSRDATWQRLVDVWWLPQWLCCCLFELI